MAPVPAWEPRWTWSGAVRGDADQHRQDIVVNANRTPVPARGRLREAVPGEADHQPSDRGSSIGAADLARIHTDDHLGRRGFAQSLIEGVEVGGDAGRLRDRLLSWDRRMAAGSQEASLFAAWRSELVRWLTRQQPLAALADVPSAPDVFDRWLEPVTRLGYVWETACQRAGDLGIDVGRGVQIALERVAAGPPRVAGVTATPWLPWYEPRPPGCNEPDLGAVGIGGDEIAYSQPQAPQASPTISGRTDGSLRLGPRPDRQQSRWVVPFGASGVPGEAHFADQLPLLGRW